MEPAPRYWFRAKRYGYGWGLPLTWQGWAVLAAFMALLMLGSALILPSGSSTTYLIYVAVLSAVLIGICRAKGEPTRWRWGG